MPESNHIEQWKPVKDWEGIYSVSSFGRVMRTLGGRCNAKAGRIMTPVIKKSGYADLLLKRKGCNRRYTIHRLVALAFIPNPHSKKYVNHKNGHRADNRLENLEWCTASENQRHSYDILGRRSVRGEKHGMVKLRAKDIQPIRNRRMRGETLESIAKSYGVCLENVYAICARRTWVHIS